MAFLLIPGLLEPHRPHARDRTGQTATGGSFVRDARVPAAACADRVDQRCIRVRNRKLRRIGAFLGAYNGYDEMDRWITTIAGLGAIGVAFCPSGITILSCVILAALVLSRSAGNWKITGS